MAVSPAAKAGYHHGDLRAALIAAGLQILEEGAEPAALSLREAARRAGVSAMAPYRHFADKDALLVALATVGFEMLAEALRQADAARDARAALDAQGIAYVAFACDHPALFRLMFGAKAPAKTGPLAQASDATFNVLASRVSSISGGAMVKDEALAKWALVHGLAMLAVDGQLQMFDETPVALAERITNLPGKRSAPARADYGRPRTLQRRRDKRSEAVKPQNWRQLSEGGPFRSSTLSSV